MEDPFPWIEEGRAMRLDGISFRDIGAKFGVAASTARYWLASQEEREQENSRRNAKRTYHPDNPSADIAPWVKRPPKKIILREAIKEAAALFAKGAISRQEMMLRITPRPVQEAI